MEEEKIGAEKFMSIDKFITELIGYHEQIKKLQSSEAYYKHLSGVLQENLNKYQTVISHLPQKVFLKDKNLLYLFANENYARTLGTTPQDISGKTNHDFFPFEAAEQRLNEDRRFLEGGQPEEKEVRQTCDGGMRVEQSLKFPIKNESGEILGILGISWDITEKKEKEETLEKRAGELAGLLEARRSEWNELQEKLQGEQAERRRLEEKLKNVEGLYSVLFENTGTAVALVEENRTLSRVNGEFEKISGYSRADVEGAKNWGEFISNGYRQDGAETAGPPSGDSLDPGMHVVAFVGRQNEGKTVAVTAARVPETGRVLVSLVDISRYKKAREELNRARKHLTELTEAMEKGVKDLDG